MSKMRKIYHHAIGLQGIHFASVHKQLNPSPHEHYSPQEKLYLDDEFCLINSPHSEIPSDKLILKIQEVKANNYQNNKHKANTSKSLCASSPAESSFLTATCLPSSNTAL